MKTVNFTEYKNLSLFMYYICIIYSNYLRLRLGVNNPKCTESLSSFLVSSKILGAQTK